MPEEKNFVTIELSRKQVDTEHLSHSEKTDKDYARIFVPNGGVLFYPVESIKTNRDNPERVYFTRPEGTELQLNYSKRREGIANIAPISEQYENYTKTVTIEDLKDMYEEERRNYAENHGFVNMTVPTAWGRHFTTNGGAKMVSISIPIPENDKDTYWSFVLPAERFRDSTKQSDMSYFGLPKKHQDDGEDYMVRLKTSDRQNDGSYKERYREISSTDLKTYVDAANERSHIKELFVSTEISSKLVREFSSKGGKPLAAVAVPVYENAESEKPCFYEIVVPSERIRAIEDNNRVVLSLFKNGPDGTDYTFTAKRSIPKESPSGFMDNMGYDVVKKNMTSTEVISYFETSSQKFKDSQQNRNREDELEETEKNMEQQKTEQNENAVNQANAMPHRRRGR